MSARLLQIAEVLDRHFPEATSGVRFAAAGELAAYADGLLDTADAAVREIPKSSNGAVPVSAVIAAIGAPRITVVPAPRASSDAAQEVGR